MHFRMWPKKIEKLLWLNEDTCLCASINPILLVSRIVGLLPIRKSCNSPRKCNFAVSKYWRVYAYTILGLYFLYVALVYGLRFFCQNEVEKFAEWYVMTFGYFINDFDSLITILLDILYSSRICAILNDLVNELPQSLNESRNIKRNLSIKLCLFFIYYFLLTLSHINVAVIRFEITVGYSLFGCSSLDKTFAVIFRGITVVFSGVQLILVSTFCQIIVYKFENVSRITTITINELIKNEYKKEDFNDKIIEMKKLMEYREKAFGCLNSLNKCIGLQTLVSNSASLYSIIYYLYRYSTTGTNTLISTNHDKWHYAMGFFYRFAKMIVYMIYGKEVNNASKLPLRAVESSQIIGCSVEVQQICQTIIMQWKGQEGFLSAFNVVNMGPWLLAPIAGNVITYLLVALQFNKDDINLRDENNNTISFYENY